MQRMRDVIRGSLARTLRQFGEEDRLAAALPAVCGSALASHCTVVGLDENRQLHLQVAGGEWMSSLLAMRGMLQQDLQRVAGVPLSGLHFEVAGAPRRRGANSGGSDASVAPSRAGRRRSPSPDARRSD